MVIPIHDKNPTRRTPIVNNLLIVANVVVFLLSPIASAGLSGGGTAVSQCQQAAYTYHWGAIPTELVHNEALTRVPTGQAVRVRTGIACVAENPPYHKSPALSVLTAMFVHGGWLHLLGNMLFLLIFGNNVEDRFGRLRYLLFYLASGYVAAYGYALVSSTATTPMVGASGAIAGVLGAYLVLYPGARVWALVPVLFFIPLRLPAWLVLGSWFLIQWWYSAGGGVTGEANVAYAAHVAGFVFGLLATLLLVPRRRPPAVVPPASWQSGW